MAIKSGQRYKIGNEENGLVFDMTTAPWNWKPGTNGKARGWSFSGGDNQQVNQLRNFEIRLIQSRYRPVDHRQAGRRPMDYPIRRAPEVPRIPSRQYSERRNASRRPRQASALGH